MKHPKKVQLISKRRVFDQFFKIDELRVKHEMYKGGLSTERTLLVFERRDAVAAVVHHQAANTIFFTEQFRAPTLEKGPGWMLEIPAGVVGADEDPRQTILRELVEEIGYRPQHADPIATFYVSPGGSSERIFLYYCAITDADKVGHGGGLIKEGEDIKIVELQVSDALARLAAGEFVDAKTLIGLQWVRLKLSTS
jgi:ADP-ribose pyrophosphatase